MGDTKYKNDLTFDERVMMAIVRAAENFKRTHSTIFKDYGLSFPQYNILRVLEASEMGQNKISVVGNIMLVPSANMTGLAKRMEQSGFLVRKSDPKDERVKLLCISEKGRKILKGIEKKKDKSIDILLKDFNQDQKAELLKAIKKIIKATTDLQKDLKGKLKSVVS
jgi:DNA-binding MarR family transcriptional regulator